MVDQDEKTETWIQFDYYSILYEKTILKTNAIENLFILLLWTKLDR